MEDAQESGEENIVKPSPVDVEAVVKEEDSNDDVVLLRATMQRERDGERITVKEEMLVKNDTPVELRRICESTSGEEMKHVEPLGVEDA